MEAGRELDALVAEKVFGFWKESGQYGERWWGNHPSILGEKAHASACVPGMLWGPNYNNVTGLPYFSTDIAAAWQVVEKMKGHGFHVFSLHHYEGVCEAEEPRWIWRATFSYPNTKTADAETASEAICLAALKALGVEVN